MALQLQNHLSDPIKIGTFTFISFVSTTGLQWFFIDYYNITNSDAILAIYGFSIIISGIIFSIFNWIIKNKVNKKNIKIINEASNQYFEDLLIRRNQINLELIKNLNNLDEEGILLLKKHRRIINNSIVILEKQNLETLLSALHKRDVNQNLDILLRLELSEIPIANTMQSQTINNVKMKLPED